MKWFAPAAVWLASTAGAVGLAVAHAGPVPVMMVLVGGLILSTLTAAAVCFD